MTNRPLPQPVRIGIYGASGSGKSYLAKKLIANCPRLVVFDPMNDYQNLKKVYSVRDLRKFIVENWKKKFQVAVQFKNIEEAEMLLSETSDLLYIVQADYPKTPMLTFCVDELSLCYPKNGKNSSGFTNLACRGRHKGINLIGISQRISQVNTNFRGNCTSNYFFRPADYVDIEILEKIIGRQHGEKIRSMRNRDYMYLKDGEIKFNLSFSTYSEK